MSVFSSSITHRSYYWQISMLCFVLGLLLAAAGHTVSQIKRNGGNSGRGFFAGSVEATAQKKSQEYEIEIAKLRNDLEALEKEKTKGTVSEKRLTEELVDNRILAGVTELVGTGVRVTLVDSAKKPTFVADNIEQRNLVHDFQISAIVNELKAADAEAISVNGQRIISRSAVRCVGPIVHINHVAASPPFVIEAIGDANTLFSAMNIAGGVLEDVRRYDPGMVKIEKIAKIHLLAYAGGTQLRFGRVPEIKSTDKDKKTDKSEKAKDAVASGDTEEGKSKQ